MGATDVTRPRPPFPPGVWTVDPAVSRVGFHVRHLGVATVAGRFTEFAGDIDGGRASGTVEVASIDTGQPVRDACLRSKDVFDAERLPQIAFTATPAADGRLLGRLTIRGVTRPVGLDLTTEQLDERTVRLRATARISRTDFGLDPPVLKKAGRRIVSDRVDLALDLILRS